jgi:malate dehydrogenase (quinone)
MLGLVEKCFPQSMDSWRPKLIAMVPSYGKQLSDSPTLAKKTLTATAKELQIAR